MACISARVPFDSIGISGEVRGFAADGAGGGGWRREPTSQHIEAVHYIQSFPCREGTDIADFDAFLPSAETPRRSLEDVEGYLPSEVFLGRADQLVIHQRRTGDR
jgi:hypothetical protein